MDDLELLRLDAAAAFEVTAGGRIGAAHGHPPGPWGTSPAASAGQGPRFFFSGCRSGNLGFAAERLGDDVAGRVGALAADEPPWFDADVRPGRLGAISDLLAPGAPVELFGPEVVFHLPRGLVFDHPAEIVRCDTEAGAALVARFERHGLPRALIDAGFLALDDFWWPWCVALQEGQVAAMAFATRLSAASAEIGVYAFPQYRRRGYAAAATAAWSTPFRNIAGAATRRRRPRRGRRWPAWVTEPWSTPPRPPTSPRAMSRRGWGWRPSARASGSCEAAHGV